MVSASSVLDGSRPGRRKRRNTSPAKTTATPDNAGKGSLIRINNPITKHPATSTHRGRPRVFHTLAAGRRTLRPPPGSARRAPHSAPQTIMPAMAHQMAPSSSGEPSDFAIVAGVFVRCMWIIRLPDYRRSWKHPGPRLSGDSAEPELKSRPTISRPAVSWRLEGEQADPGGGPPLRGSGRSLTTETPRIGGRRPGAPRPHVVEQLPLTYSGSSSEARWERRRRRLAGNKLLPTSMSSVAHSMEASKSRARQKACQAQSAILTGR